VSAILILNIFNMLSIVATVDGATDSESVV
jgi:hypothetical protein